MIPVSFPESTRDSSARRVSLPGTPTWSIASTNMAPTTARYTYMDCYKPDGGNTAQLYQGLNALARLDYKTGNVEYFSPGPSCLVQEPCFSPRHPDAGEGDGFLITMIDNQRLNRNEVVCCAHKLSCVFRLTHASSVADHPRHKGLSGSRCQDYSSIS